MKLFTLVLLLGFLSASFAISTDEPTGHPLGTDIAPVSNFGMKYHPVLEIRRMHAGVDFEVKEGTKVYATADGTVNVAKESSGYGKHIVIQHANGYETIYAHLDDFFVASEEVVLKGELIGVTGNTGLSQGPHLHYEIRKDRKPLDPMGFLP